MEKQSDRTLSDNIDWEELLKNSKQQISENRELYNPNAGANIVPYDSVQVRIQDTEYPTL